MLTLEPNWGQRKGSKVYIEILGKLFKNLFLNKNNETVFDMQASLDNVNSKLLKSLPRD